MKCPLTYKEELKTYQGKDYGVLPCLKEECAWWLEDVGLCAIKELALETRYTQLRLQDMLTHIQTVFK